MKKLSSLIVLFFLCAACYAYNPFWIHIDKKAICGLVRINKMDAKSVELYFLNQKPKKDTINKKKLGFGWSMTSLYSAGGYISISANFYYYNDSLLSYDLTAQLPEEEGLKRMYKKWYKDYFQYSGSDLDTFKFNEDAILRPLKEYRGNLHTVPVRVIDYMKPSQGAFGYNGAVRQTRREFIEVIKDSLTDEQVIFMMYGINPSSRLMAIEYYLKKINKPGTKPPMLEWIRQNINETAKVELSLGCYSETVETMSLFHPFFQWEEN